MSLGLLQPLNALLRPNKPHDGKPPTASRRAWHALHAGSGWLAIGLSIPTIILGITFVPGVAANRGRFQFGYGAALVAVFGLLVFSFCDRETYRRNRGGPAVSASEEQHMTEMKGKVEEST
jgi:Na+/melibiose symporter-like transporter